MQHFTILDDITVSNIFAQYELGKVLDYKILNGGSENTNYWVRTSEGGYALTICEQKSLEEATNLARLLVHLEESGFASSQMIATQSSAWVGTFSGKPVLLKQFIKGEVVAGFSAVQFELLGQQLAHLHTVECPSFVPRNLGYGMEEFPKAKEHAPDSDFSDWLLEIATYIQASLKEDLPKAIIHSDLFFNNVIVAPEGNRVTIMDFEEAAYYYRVYDIGMTIVGNCAEGEQLNLEKTQSLLKGYQHKNPLTEAERMALQACTVYAAAATGFWRFMNFNFVRPDEANKDKYKKMWVLAKQIKAISVVDFREVF